VYRSGLRGWSGPRSYAARDGEKTSVEFTLR
jgi:hypothetical protein